MTLLELEERVQCAQPEAAQVYDEGKLHNLIARYRDCAVIEVIKDLDVLKGTNLFPLLQKEDCKWTIGRRELGQSSLNLCSTPRKGGDEYEYLNVTVSSGNLIFVFQVLTFISFVQRTLFYILNLIFH